MNKSFTTDEVLEHFDRFHYNPEEWSGQTYDEYRNGDYTYLGEHVDWGELEYRLYDDWDTIDGVYQKTGKAGKDIPGLGWVTVPDHFGGEGQGDQRWTIYKIEATGQYFRKDGYYASYDGTNWGDGDFAEVHPKEKVVTVYEK